MKKLLKASLVAAVFNIFALSANAENEANATNMLILDVSQSVMQEIKANVGEQKLSKIEIAKKLIAKLRARIVEFKDAYESDCVSKYGKNKISACKCLVEKTNFDEMFNLLEKQMTDGDEREKIQKELRDMEGEVQKACGL